jgi:ABC-type cobalamin/Fe3+-siderophores transport system ATPase subunit
MVKLTIGDIDCYYGSTKILEAIQFAVKSGEFLGILGPNGSGKTTLLKSISRILKPKKGAILIGESNIYDMKTLDVAKQLAVVPQTTPVTSTSLHWKWFLWDAIRTWLGSQWKAKRTWISQRILCS